MKLYGIRPITEGKISLTSKHDIRTTTFDFSDKAH